MAWMTQSSEATISRVFVAWAVFLSTLFECLDLSPLPGFVESSLKEEQFNCLKIFQVCKYFTVCMMFKSLTLCIFFDTLPFPPEWLQVLGS